MTVDYTKFCVEKDNCPVYTTPKFEEAVRATTELIESGKIKGLNYGDFWIQKNKTKNGGVLYSSLIITHTGCLKINDAMPREQRFDPTALLDRDGQLRKTINADGSMTMDYLSTKQMIYTCASVSKLTCRIPYFDEMLEKRLFDRVVKLLSKLAYAGIYGEEESEDVLKNTELNTTVSNRMMADATPTAGSSKAAIKDMKAGGTNASITGVAQPKQAVSTQKDIRRTDNDHKPKKEQELTLEQALKHCCENHEIGKFQGKPISVFVYGDGRKPQNPERVRQNLKIASNLQGMDGIAARRVLQAVNTGELTI